MPNRGISWGEFERRTAPIVGMTISRPWKWVSWAAFLELGALHLETIRRGRQWLRGEKGIHLFCGWRLEHGHTIVCGSGDSEERIEAQLRKLKGVRILAVNEEPGVPDLVVRFSTGRLLRTRETALRPPDWTVKLAAGEYLTLSPSTGGPQIGDGVGEYTPEDAATDEADRITSERWGRPVVEPRGGECWDCRHFARLSGVFWLTDHGACTAAGGPLDGRMVYVRSGCPSFEPESKGGESEATDEAESPGVDVDWDDFARRVVALRGARIARALPAFHMFARLEIEGGGEFELACDWRVEEGRAVIAGSYDDRHLLAAALGRLAGERIQDVFVEDGVRDLRIEFESGRVLRSCAVAQGRPQWTLRLPTGEHLSPAPATDASRISPEGRRPGAEERELVAGEEAVAARWGTPAVEPRAGDCRTCRSFVPLSGFWVLSDHGACTAEGGPLDARAISADGGCPAWTPAPAG